MPIKLILFDLDGTLVDTCMDITNALNYALKDYVAKTFTVGETKKLVGEGISRLIEKVLDNNMQFKGAVIEKFLGYYSGHLVDNSRAYPYVKEVLEQLGSYKKAIISNKKEDLSVRLLQQLGLLAFFDLVIGSDTAPERKPSAVPVVYALTQLDVKAEEAVIVGDSNYDIEAGKKAGVGTIAVTYGYRGKEYLRDADHMIDSIRDLPRVLDIRVNELI